MPGVREATSIVELLVGVEAHGGGAVVGGGPGGGDAGVAQGGWRSATEWLARTAGIGHGQAKAALETADRLRSQRRGAQGVRGGGAVRTAGQRDRGRRRAGHLQAGSIDPPGQAGVAEGAARGVRAHPRRRRPGPGRHPRSDPRRAALPGGHRHPHRRPLRAPHPRRGATALEARDRRCAVPGCDSDFGSRSTTTPSTTPKAAPPPCGTSTASAGRATTARPTTATPSEAHPAAANGETATATSSPKTPSSKTSQMPARSGTTSWRTI